MSDNPLKKYLEGYNKDNKTGECPVCTINTYTVGGSVMPIVFPCGIHRTDANGNVLKEKNIPQTCPWETEADRKKIKIAGESLGNIIQSDLSDGKV